MRHKTLPLAAALVLAPMLSLTATTAHATLAEPVLNQTADPATSATVAVPIIAKWEAPLVSAVATSAAEVRAERAAAEAAAEAARVAAATDALRAQGARVSEAGWVRPVDGGRFTSAYGPRAAIPGVVGAIDHNGIDLAAPSGTPIRTAYDGTVTYVGNGHPDLGLSGWVVVVDHGDGLRTSYNHMDHQPPVTVGQRVTRGTVIAHIGSSGRSSGPHLHLAVWVGDEHTDPVPFFAGKGLQLR